MLNQFRLLIFFENFFQKDLVFFLEYDLSSISVSLVQQVFVEVPIVCKLWCSGNISLGERGGTMVPLFQ